MKRSILISMLAFFVTFVFTVSILMFSRTRERDVVFSSAKSSFETIVRLEVSGIDDGYFQWTELYNWIGADGPPGARESMEEIKAKYPFILSADIVKGSPPENESYVIKSEGVDILTVISVRNSVGDRTLPGYHGLLRLDSGKILGSLQYEPNLRIAAAGGIPFAFGLKVEFVNFILSLKDFFLAFFASIGVFLPTLFWMRRRSSFFYESRGLESIIFLFEQSEKYSSNHSRRVAALCAFIGMNMKFRGRTLRDLYIAALLHDIGKLSIPLDILIKNGSLTPKEFLMIQQHPLSSAKILRNFRELAHLGDFVLYHHERMDGSGYPEGISGAIIPLESRIIAVADVFDALVGERPYRSPINVDEAFDHLRSIALDQGIVEFLARSYKDFDEYKLPKWILGVQSASMDVQDAIIQGE